MVQVLTKEMRELIRKNPRAVRKLLQGVLEGEGKDNRITIKDADGKGTVLVVKIVEPTE